MNCKLFITDIDGVWTDGGMYYDQTGNELKKFNTSDALGVIFLRQLGIPTAIITGEDVEIVRKRSEKLKIQHLFMGVKNKLVVAQKLCAELDITLKNVAYIGDDVNDILLLREAGLSAAPANAPDYIKKEVQWIIPVNGGDGAFRAFVEKYLSENNMLQAAIDKCIEEIQNSTS